jgi:hypothetical protein
MGMNSCPVLIHLKVPSSFPHHKQYPFERMCPLTQQIPIAETSKASTGCLVQDKINRMGAGGM